MNISILKQRLVPARVRGKFARRDCCAAARQFLAMADAHATPPRVDRRRTDRHASQCGIVACKACEDRSHRGVAHRFAVSGLWRGSESESARGRFRERVCGLGRLMQEARDETISWRWRDAAIDLGITACGEGPTVVMLPALSSISTRRQMAPLQLRLAPHYRTLAVDWPGFGDLPRPAIAWTPAAYAACLGFVLDTVARKPHAVIAAGHAAGYALAHGSGHANAFRSLVLLAPTWRGPLPTMMKGRRPFFERIPRAFDVPVLGALLYALNVNRMVVRYMAAGHVYVDSAWLDGKRLEEKLAVTRAPGARYASVRFVTGTLDPLSSREEFLDRARRIRVPMLTLYGDQTPRGSRAEIEALATVQGMTSQSLPLGKLSFYEEFPDAAVSAILPFLAGVPRQG
jgi:pimeloyl-ACP methyl ester carboxylesterase